LRYDAARALSVASKAISRTDKFKGRQLADRCLQLLKEAVNNGDADFSKMGEDDDLDPIREYPAFADIMKAGHPDRRYTGVWSSDASFEAIAIYGVDPASQLQRCRDLISQGYRPVSLTLTRATSDGPFATASVWHRPVVSEELKDRLAERQATAAVALVRMGKAEDVWSLIRHSVDPRVRSFILNWLGPLGADPKLIAAEFDRLGSPIAHHAPPATQNMEALLFHPETSIRRALIQALGPYGPERLSSGQREALTRKLLDLYCNDPDAGIHGASEQTLRRWGQQGKLKEADAQLIKRTDWGNWRWFINGQGQSFSVIEGPVEFRMGSPPTEPNRHTTLETPRRVVIPRRFAIATKEVSKEQWQSFERTHTQHGLPPSSVNQFSPDPDGPMSGFTWYIAAEYCNWLSEQEGLPKHQWCYVPNEAGAYADGMSIPADVLERTGYRLPTEPEWEYACRSGTVTSYYFGLSTELVDKYAWSQANSKDRAWSCGSLLPNDLGLFDMLGNEFEWVQDSMGRPMPKKGGIVIDIMLGEYVHGTTHSMLRGGAFNILPTGDRSALRWGTAPSYRYTDLGFRPARTCP
jgi:formylglycine-generating enzyme required for sulfatase activity